MLAEILELRGDAAFHRRRTPNLPQNLRLIEPREVAVGDWVDIRGTYRPCDLSTCFDTSVLAQADDNYPGRLWEVVEATERSVALQLENCQARRLRKQLRQVWRPYLSIAQRDFKISLTRGKEAIVSAEDYDYLSQWNWSLKPSGNSGYAIRQRKKGEAPGPTSIYMHRVIASRCGMDTSDLIDHKNRNGLDNRRENLRSANAFGNTRNSPPRKNGSSKFKGVSFHQASQKWVASINPGSLHIGCFKTEEEAAIAYDDAALVVFAEFAYLNFPEDRRIYDSPPFWLACRISQPAPCVPAVETMLRGSTEETRTLDALGRGRGDGRRGGVRAVQLTRKLKRGKGQATYTQWRLQWEEPRGGGVYSATRNLKKAIAADVRRDWENGLTAKEICKKYNLEKPKHA